MTCVALSASASSVRTFSSVGRRSSAVRRAVRGPVRCVAAAAVEKDSVSVVLLAGGVGKRMKADMPKQYLPLLGTPIALYSLKKFAEMEEVGEIVVVCDPSYRDIFEGCPVSKPVKFALPGKERQDSVFNGLSEVREGAALAAIHDSARPLVDLADVRRCCADAMEHGAAVLAVRCKATVKEANDDLSIAKTLDEKQAVGDADPAGDQAGSAQGGLQARQRERIRGDRRRFHRGVHGRAGADHRGFLRKHQGHHPRGHVHRGEASQRAGRDGVKRVMGIIMGYTVEARPSLKVRAPLENFNTREHTFVIDQTTVRWSRSKGKTANVRGPECVHKKEWKKKKVSPPGIEPGPRE